MGKSIKRFLKYFFIAVFAVVLIGAGGFGILILSEYKPEPVEKADINGEASLCAGFNQEIKVMTWNIGYAALGEEEDFFMDGGKGVTAQSKEEVENNLVAINRTIAELSPDIAFLQEVDKKSARTFNIDEVESIGESFQNMSCSYVRNFKCLFIPYPMPPLANMDAGLVSLSKFEVMDAERISLPNPFSLPVRAFNLKRCLLVERIPIEGTDKELVMANLHLEAYDDGTGKAAQTRFLAEFLNKEYEKGNYVIAGGDFNQSFSNIDISKYKTDNMKLWQPGFINAEEFGEHFNLLMDCSEPTCRSLDKPYDDNDKNFQYYMIDGFIVSDNIEVASIETKNFHFKNSDHNPVLMTVRLKGE